MDIHVDLDTIKLFCSVVVFGVLNGYFMYRKGAKKGWDDLAYILDSEGIICVDNTGEIKRNSDAQFRKRQAELECEE